MKVGISESIIVNGRYICGSSLPVVNEINPKDPIKAIGKIKYLHPGMVFTITGYQTEHFDRLYKKKDKHGKHFGPWLKLPGAKVWYIVHSRTISGFINEVALMGKSLTSV